MLTASDVSPTGRNLTAAVVIVVALVLQVSVANRLPLPGAVTPDLVLLSVVALALTCGPLMGVVAGFGAGLAADIVPPADHTIGRYALVYCVIGYLCGLASDEMDRSAVVPFFAVAVGALAGTVLYAGVGMMLGDPRADWHIVARVVPLQVVYDVLASPFVVWAVLRAMRRYERERARDRFDLPPARYRALSRM
ncbi:MULTISPECIES: rod shape-determining protein MreD [Thermomonospora]|uniref:Rod shape-determining protein MreD n=1 Tax=Thermomonospora curvata (strain ATCC 19995 / DSM 43183 / JCM 3096 / KCTC 9072 / NBRC 15933 / NCIMB 10081 / Henssen B9) TaxID=471852 RepID=D1AAV7_THECD|nr:MULTISPECIES: rod shape-determining protein MreD [Thermomonospora]ACY97117.1 rod shape-determining protein MreD [Thermomonospora curvata DSM 43183]PKK14983.1 MAG: rod shape-determining protein MreD [Thermomonospora sp. CIF 1]